VALAKMPDQLFANDAKVGKDPDAYRGRRDDKAAGVGGVVRFGKRRDGQGAGGYGFARIEAPDELWFQGKPEL